MHYTLLMFIQCIEQCMHTYNICDMAQTHITHVDTSIPQQLMPEKRFLFFPMLPKISGSRFLATRITQWQPHMHVFGHTHFSWDATLDDDGVFVCVCVCVPARCCVACVLKQCAMSPCVLHQRMPNHMIYIILHRCSVCAGTPLLPCRTQTPLPKPLIFATATRTTTTETTANIRFWHRCCKWRWFAGHDTERGCIWRHGMGSGSCRMAPSGGVCNVGASRYGHFV